MVADPFTELSLADRPRSFPVPQALQDTLQELADGMRWQLIHQLRDMERALCARSDAVVLCAPSERTSIDFTGNSYTGDWNCRVKRGGVTVTLVYYRAAEASSYDGRLYHRGHCWSGHEQRRDVFGNEWRRQINGYLVMDDFGDLVEAPEC